MKKPLIFAVIVILFFIVFLGFGPETAEAFKWSQVGRAPLMPGPPIEDKISLEEKMILHKGEIIEGLKLAQPTWDAAKVFETAFAAVKRGNVIEAIMLRGQEFSWMIFKGRAGVSVLRNVEWVGNDPLQGFVFAFFYGRELKFFIPKKCGNISLMKASPPSQPEVRSDYREQRSDYYRQPEQQQPIIVYQDCRPQQQNCYQPQPQYYPQPQPQYSQPRYGYESFFSFLPPPPPFFFGGYKKEKHYQYPPSRPEPRPQRRPPGVRTR